MRAGRGSWLWKCRVSSCVLSPFEQHWHGSRIVVQSPCIDFGLVVLVEIGTSGGKTAADDWLWDVMPALAHTLRNAIHSGLRVGQGQKVQINAVADRKSTRLNSSHSQISYAV